MGWPGRYADVIEYFKNLAAETGIPYQNLINLYLRECAQTGKEPTLSWAFIGSQGVGLHAAFLPRRSRN